MTTVKKKPGFAGVPVAQKATGADIAIFGAPHCSVTKDYPSSFSASAPAALRRSQVFAGASVGYWDFDRKGPLLDPKKCSVVDLGDVKTTARGASQNRKQIEARTHGIILNGAIPFMLGGDSSGIAPFVAGFSATAPVVVVHLGRDILWCSSRHGDRFSFASSLRRVSEMSHVWRIVQIGARGIGCEMPEDVMAAQHWGAHLFSARQLHTQGTAAILESIPVESDCVLIVSADVLDVAEMPAIAFPVPGGLSYITLSDVLEKIAARGRLVGVALVDFVPSRDKTGTAVYTAQRLGTELLGLLAREIKSLR